MNTVIDAGQVLVGDKIRVTFQVEDVTITREGVVADVTPNGGMYTEKIYSLGPIKDSVIELLDRPKPKVVVPTLPNAVVTYRHGWKTYAGAGDLEKRTAVRSEDGSWVSYDDGGLWMNGFSSDEYFSQRVSESDLIHDLTVIFAGVAK